MPDLRWTPTPNRTTTRVPSPERRRAMLVLLTGGILAGLLVAGPGAAAAPARPHQIDPATTVTTTENLLEGQTTVAPSTTASPTTISTKDAQSSATADAREVWNIVIALLVVAFLLLVLTIGYWRRTRPALATVAVPRHARGSAPPPAAPGDDG